MDKEFSKKEELVNIRLALRNFDAEKFRKLQSLFGLEKVPLVNNHTEKVYRGEDVMLFIEKT